MNSYISMSELCYISMLAFTINIYFNYRNKKIDQKTDDLSSSLPLMVTGKVDYQKLEKTLNSGDKK